MNFWFCLCSKSISRADTFVADQIQPVLSMPKEDGTRSGVFNKFGKKAIDKHKKEMKNGAGKSKAPKKPAPAALEVARSDEHVSASPTPPTPASPRSPTYERETWWDPFGALSRRIDDATASIKELKDRVKQLEEEREKQRADGSVFGKLD
jgi:hypothetical protein